MSLACSVCDFELGSAFVAEWSHPLLRVALCTECKDRWEASDAARAPAAASAAAEHDDSCVWCGQEGEVTCCDTCSKTVCVDCFTRAGVAPPSEDERFACFACDGAAIAPHAAALEDYRATIPPVADDADAPSDAGKQARLDALLRCESERDDALQHLESDSVARTRAAIEAELGEHAPRSVVDDEVEAWKALWSRLSDELHDASVRMQDALEAEGVDTRHALRAYERSGARVASAISAAWDGLEVVDENGDPPPSPPDSDDEDSQLVRSDSAEQRQRDAVAADKPRLKEHARRRKAARVVSKRANVTQCYELIDVEHPRAVRVGARVRQAENDARGYVREDAAPEAGEENFTICVVRSTGSSEFNALDAIEVEIDSDSERERGAASSSSSSSVAAAASAAAASAAPTRRWVSLGVPESVKRSEGFGLYPFAVYECETPTDFVAWRKKDSASARVVARLVRGRGATGVRGWGDAADGSADGGEEEGEEGPYDGVHELTGGLRDAPPQQFPGSARKWKTDLAVAISMEDSALSMLQAGLDVPIKRVDEETDATEGAARGKTSKRSRRGASTAVDRLSCTRAVAPPTRVGRKKLALSKAKASGAVAGESESAAMRPEHYVMRNVRLPWSDNSVAEVNKDGEVVLFTGTVQCLDPGDGACSFTVRFEDGDEAVYTLSEIKCGVEEYERFAAARRGSAASPPGAVKSGASSSTAATDAARDGGQSGSDEFDDSHSDSESDDWSSADEWDVDASGASKAQRGAAAVCAQESASDAQPLDGSAAKVSFLLFTVIFYANRAHNLTRSP
jgi:hypothetical protein